MTGRQQYKAITHDLIQATVKPAYQPRFTVTKVKETVPVVTIAISAANKIFLFHYLY
jgi:hypothetical protein